MEFEETDLHMVINDGALGDVPQAYAKHIFYNILCAVNFMHTANIIHRDLKPDNILINEDCQIKICDFGISRTLPESHLGKGSGNTHRVRESVCKKDLKSNHDPIKIK